MSIRGGVGRFYERMSNQIWDSEYHEPARRSAATSATIFEPVKPRLRPRHDARTLPYNYPRPSGLTAGLNQYGGLSTDGRASTSSTRHRADVSRQLVPRRAARRSAKTWWSKATTSDRAGSNMYVRWDINRFNGDLLDGRLDRILPGFSQHLYAQAIDKSHYHGVTVGGAVNRADLNLGVAYTAGQGHRPLEHGHAAAAAGRLRSRRSGRRAVRRRHPSQARAVGQLDDSRARPAGVGQGHPGRLAARRACCSRRPARRSRWSATARRSRPIRNAAGAIVGNTGCDYNADGTDLDRPNVPSFGDSLSAAQQRRLPQRNLHGLGLPDAGARAVPGRSDAIRSAARATSTWTSSFIKSLKIPWAGNNSADVQFRIESFNLFNTTNLDFPIGTRRPLFGRSVSAAPGRIVQVGGRVV